MLRTLAEIGINQQYARRAPREGDGKIRRAGGLPFRCKAAGKKDQSRLPVYCLQEQEERRVRKDSADSERREGGQSKASTWGLGAG
jgi:hypothetical protein